MFRERLLYCVSLFMHKCFFSFVSVRFLFQSVLMSLSSFQGFAVYFEKTLSDFKGDKGDKGCFLWTVIKVTMWEQVWAIIQSQRSNHRFIKGDISLRSIDLEKDENSDHANSKRTKKIIFATFLIIKMSDHQTKVSHIEADRPNDEEGEAEDERRII